MRSTSAIVAAVLAAGTLAACSSTSQPYGSSGSGQAGDGSKPLNVVVAALPQYLGNPFQAVAPPRTETMSAVFDTLTRVDAKGVQPQLATKWTQDSPTAWTFTLRTGVTFSNGEAFDSSSVVASVTGLTDPANKAAIANNYLSAVASAKAISPTEVQVTTKTPDGILPAQLAALVMIPPKYYAEAGADKFAQQPIGTGPYKVDSISSTKLVLSAFPGSWRKPTTQHITITAMADPSSRSNALQSGQADLNLEADLAQVDALKAAGFSVNVIKNEGVLTLGFVTTAGTTPLSDPRVRYALNEAIDRDTIVKSLYEGLTTPANQGVTPGIVGYDDSVPQYKYDPNDAKQLLAQAGYANGFSFSASVTTGSFVNDSAVFQAVQSDLAKIGVKLTLNQVTVAQIISFLVSGKYPTEAFSTAYQTSPEQDATKAYFTYSCLRANPIFCDQTAADLIAKATAESDASTRASLLSQLAKEAHQNPSAIYLVNGLYLAAASKKVHGYTEDQSTNVDWEKITVN